MKKKSKFSFSNVARIRYNRSAFDLSHGHKTTCNVGELIPFDLQEIVAGDTFKVRSDVVARVTSSFLKPVIDNLVCDVFYFWIPGRQLFEDYAKVFGESASAWAPRKAYAMPYCDFISNGVEAGDLAQYFGVPVGKNSDFSDHYCISDLPFRAYAKVYDEWFRNQNTEAPIAIDYSDNFAEGNHNAFSITNYHGKPAKVTRYPDYFSSCLPAPQKGDSVGVPLTAEAGNVVPIRTTNSQVYNPASPHPLMFRLVTSPDRPPDAGTLVNDDGGETYSQTGSVTNSTAVYPANLAIASDDLSKADLAITVNDMRLAFQTQKLLEKAARGGSRYTEYLSMNFGVDSNDGLLQRTEFLGGRSFPITVQQVAQTSQGSSESPLANLAAFSLSNGKSGYVKSFKEHGYVLGLLVVRQKHTYQQGTERFLFRRSRLDFYDPVFSNIGEQPVYMAELYSKGNFAMSPLNDNGNLQPTIFGYNEAWADLRYRPSRVSGALATAANEGLDIWHFADNYANQPTLASIMDEIPDYVDRTLSVPSSTAPQFILDIWSTVRAVRVMPTFSTPGLIDHH